MVGVVAGFAVGKADVDDTMVDVVVGFVVG